MGFLLTHELCLSRTKCWRQAESVTQNVRSIELQEDALAGSGDGEDHMAALSIALRS
jgi:hypothetical protein